METEKIIFQFKEIGKIEDVINSIDISKYKCDNIFEERLRLYVKMKASRFIKHHNKNLEYNECNIFTVPYLPKYIFIILYTKTNVNHPYLLYFKLDDILLNYLIPYGGDKFQANYDKYYRNIQYGNKIETTAILTLLDKTIYIRKIGVFDSKQFSILRCYNISNCIKKMKELESMKISQSEKERLQQHYNDFYISKAIEFLKYYFYLLNNKLFNEAFLFLKGDDEMYKKQRLNTFFIDDKIIIGHLEIFISLYELYFATKQKLLQLNKFTNN